MMNNTRIEFLVESIGKIKEEEAVGEIVIYHNNQDVWRYPANAGGWGRGPLPYGEYEITYIDPKSDKSFVLFGLGWFANLIPKFKTDRTNLVIHPDGGAGTDGVEGYAGTLGCVGIPFKGLGDSITCRNLIRDGLEHGAILFTCRSMLADARA
jgi:hypothetical protein